MLHFFVPMKRIPSATHQMKKIAVRNGKPCVYEPPEVKEVRATFMAHFAKFAPDAPLTGPLVLTTRWIYPATKTHPARMWKTSRPDTDNLVKMLKDVLTALHFWQDDAQVAAEHILKYYDKLPGIYVEIYEVREIGE